MYGIKHYLSKDDRSFTVRLRNRFRRHSFGEHLAGLWFSRHFDEHGILVVSEGRPYPKVINKGGRLSSGSCQFYSGVRLEIAANASLEIGNGTYLNRNTLIIAEKQVKIGKRCKISWDVVIMDSDQHPLHGRYVDRQPVIIEDKVWIGCRAMILKGVTIGRSSIVAAGSVVTKSIPPNSIYGGVPARRLGRVDKSGVYHLHSHDQELSIFSTRDPV